MRLDPIAWQGGARAADVHAIALFDLSGDQLFADVASWVLNSRPGGGLSACCACVPIAA